MQIFHTNEIKLIEKNSIVDIGIPEIILMENAAFALCSAVLHLKNRPKKCAIICGCGNNGGDGFACGRKLTSYGIDTTIFYIDKTSKFSESTLLNYNILKNSNIKMIPLTSSCDFNGFDVIIDALFGTGLNKPLDNEYRKIIENANNANGYKISADIPSGLFADSNEVKGIVFKADKTVTFIGLKLCHTLYPAKSYCGEVIVNNISINTAQCNIQNNITYATKNNIPKIKRRNRDTHKGNYGHSLIIGGSFSMTGAAYIASLSALKIGSGLVSTIIPTNSIDYFINTPEIMLSNIGNNSYFTENDINDVISIINNKKISTICIGNGLGKNSETKLFVKQLIKNTNIPIIIDADALNDLNKDNYSFLSNRCIITPHIKEFSIMINKSVDEVKYNSIALASNFAVENNIIVALKSADTIIAYPNGKIIITDFGSPSLAKAGSGDCFAGIITGLVSQKYSLEDSVVIACYILGKSSKISENKYSQYSVIITDVINNFGDAINDIKEDS